MSKSIRGITKHPGPGRPKTTGKGEPVMVRLHEPQLSKLDAWIARQKEKPSRPEAIRQLLEDALKGKG